MTPADLTPDDSDAQIVATLAAFRADRWSRPLAQTRIHDGQQQVWSKRQDGWVTVAVFAAEWRHMYRFRAVVGDEETVRAVSRYERTLGL